MNPPDYGYNQLFQLAKSAYDQSLAGYRANLASISGRAGSLGVQYDALLQNVLGSLSGSMAGRRQEILDQYMANLGNLTQGALRRGLGNFTVMDALQRGAYYDRVKAENALAGEFADKYASYMANIGQQKLQSQQELGRQWDAVYQAMLGYQGDVLKYLPDPVRYASLSQQEKQMAMDYAMRQRQMDLDNMYRQQQLALADRQSIWDYQMGRDRMLLQAFGLGLR